MPDIQLPKLCNKDVSIAFLPGEGCKTRHQDVVEHGQERITATRPVFFIMELVTPSKPSALSTSSWVMAAESSGEEIGSISKARASSLNTVVGTPRTEGSGGAQEKSPGSYKALNLASNSALTKSAMKWGSVDSTLPDSRASMPEDLKGRKFVSAQNNF